MYTTLKQCRFLAHLTQKESFVHHLESSNWPIGIKMGKSLKMNVESYQKLQGDSFYELLPLENDFSVSLSFLYYKK